MLSTIHAESMHNKPTSEKIIFNCWKMNGCSKINFTDNYIAVAFKHCKTRQWDVSK
jgi:hypothetical protein